MPFRLVSALPNAAQVSLFPSGDQGPPRPAAEDPRSVGRLVGMDEGLSLRATWRGADVDPSTSGQGQAREWSEREAAAGIDWNSLVPARRRANEDELERLRRAAQGGDADAAFDLWERLVGVDRDEAVRWLRRSAEAGHAYGMYEL